MLRRKLENRSKRLLCSILHVAKARMVTALAGWEQTPPSSMAKTLLRRNPGFLPRKHQVFVKAGGGRSEEGRAVPAPAFQNIERKLSQRARAGRMVPGPLLAALITPFSLPAYIGASLIGLEAVTTTPSLLLAVLGSVTSALGKLVSAAALQPSLLKLSAGKGAVAALLHLRKTEKGHSLPRSVPVAKGKPSRVHQAPTWDLFFAVRAL